MSSDCVCTVLLSSTLRQVMSFRSCTVVTTYIVTQLVTGYGSTHNALVTIFIMTDSPPEVAELLKQLLTQVALHGETLNFLIAQRNNVANSTVSSESDLSAERRSSDVPVVPEVENPAHVTIREDLSKSSYFVTRELGNGIPVLSDKNYALWKAHVLADVRSNPEWTSGKAALLEVLTSNIHPHEAALHSILWNKLTDTLKSQA